MSAPVKSFSFIPRIRGSRDVIKLTAEKFTQRAQENGGKPNFTLQEHFTSETPVKPFYDWDAKYKTVPEAAELSELEKKHLDDFQTIVEKLHPGKTVEFAQRHGPLEGAGVYVYKISFRAFVQGVKTTVLDIPRHVRAVLGLGPKETHPNLDLSPYKPKGQLLSVIFGCKDTDEIKRYLIPLDRTSALSSFLAQNTEDDDETLVVHVPETEPGTDAAVAKKRGRPRKATSAADAEPGAGGIPEQTDGGGAALSHFVDVTTEGNTGCVLLAATDFFGERFIMQERLKRVLVDITKQKLLFPTEKKWCYIRRDTHVGNNPYIIVSESGAMYRCPDEECKKLEVKMIPFKDLPEALGAFFNRKFFGDKVADDAMLDAKLECKRNIQDNFPEEDSASPQHALTKFITPTDKQVCKYCKNDKMTFEHGVGGWCLRCVTCHKQWPNSLTPIDEKDYPKLVTVLQQLNVSVTINNFTQINNFLGGEVEFYPDFTGDDLVVFENPVENQLFIESLQGTDVALSRFSTYHFRNRFHCTSEKKWYMYEGHCWHEGAADLIYKEAMGKLDYLHFYRRMSLHFENQPLQTDDIRKKAKMLRKLSVALEDGKQREKIVTDSIIKFHEFRPRFAEELNTQNVMVFEDGVYDFDSFTFGPGTPDRAITMCVPQRYIPFDAENEHVKFLTAFFDQVLPDRQVRDYFLQVLGIAVTMDTSQQQFYIMTGKGGNGKGKVMTLLEECLGDYYQAIPPALLTKPREAANQSNEAMMVLKKARCAVAQEAESTDIIQAGFLKSVTGQDTLSSRENYGKQVKFKTSAKFFLVVNSIPVLSENTQAIWRRVRVVDFPVSFVENPDPTDPFQKAIDFNMDSKLKAAAPHFLSLLIHYYHRYVDGGLNEPAKVKEVTERYKDSNDVVKEFVAEQLVRDDSYNVPWVNVSNAFKKYSSQKLKNDVLQNALAKHGLVYVDTTFVCETPNSPPLKHFRGYKGWRLISTSNLA